MLLGYYIILSALAASRRLTKTHERNSDKHLPNFHAVPVLCPYINKCSSLITLEQVGCNSLYHPSKLATQAFLRRCDTSRPLEEYLSRTRKFVILKRALACAIDQRAPWRTFFLTSLHCFIILKMSINAAGPAECCVSTTVQLVMYTY